MGRRNAHASISDAVLSENGSPADIDGLGGGRLLRRSAICSGEDRLQIRPADRFSQVMIEARYLSPIASFRIRCARDGHHELGPKIGILREFVGDVEAVHSGHT